MKAHVRGAYRERILVIQHYNYKPGLTPATENARECKCQEYENYEKMKWEMPDSSPYRQGNVNIFPSCVHTSSIFNALLINIRFDSDKSNRALGGDADKPSLSDRWE